MGQQPSVKDIQQREQSQTNKSAETTETADSGGKGTSISLDSLGISRKQLLILGLIVAVLVAWKLRSGGDGESASKQDVEDLKDADLSDVTVTEDDENEDIEIRLPTDPDDELEKDAAIVDYFKRAGHIEGDDD